MNAPMIEHPPPEKRWVLNCVTPFSRGESKQSEFWHEKFLNNSAPPPIPQLPKRLQFAEIILYGLRRLVAGGHVEGRTMYPLPTP